MPGQKPGDPGEPRQTALYIQRMASELERMARGAGLGFLAYLLRMVEEDARNTADGKGREGPA